MRYGGELRCPVKEAVSLEEVLRHYQVPGLRRHRSQREGGCPIHRGKRDDSFRASLTKNVFHCLRLAKLVVTFWILSRPHGAVLGSRGGIAAAAVVWGCPSRAASRGCLAAPGDGRRQNWFGKKKGVIPRDRDGGVILIACGFTRPDSGGVVALMGSSLSPEQESVLVERFKQVVPHARMEIRGRTRTSGNFAGEGLK